MIKEIDKTRALFALTIFISAFLLFQIQPMVAKIILPRFGGVPAVWTTCMLFFQVVLLVGYALAHFLIARGSRVAQLSIVVGLALFAAARLDLIPDLSSALAPEDSPQREIVALLAQHLGIPYLVLSMTSPLLQAWYSRIYLGAVPYRLYSLSNVGSFLALLSYPALFEVWFPLSTQSHIWGWGFVIYAIFISGLAVRAYQTSADSVAQTREQSPAPSRGKQAIWLLYSFVGSVALLAITNHICSDLAPMPLLWVIPLSIYLLSFILVFESDRWYQPFLFCVLFLFSLFLLADPYIAGVNAYVVTAVLFLFFVLFLCCMIAHGELAQLRPSREHLTLFYLWMAIGGAAGGIFVSLLAPKVFVTFVEYPLVLAAVAAIACYRLFHELANKLRGYRIALQLAIGLLFLGSMAFAIQPIHSSAERPVAQSRNFYGVLRAVDRFQTDPENTIRLLLHGRINHGSQLRAPGRELTPTSYYGEGSGIALAFQNFRQLEPRRIGIIGLGVGVAGILANARDTVRYYEINPQVIEFAEKYFTFLSHSAARVELVLGDARISLEQEKAQQFDILVLDAFTGDAIPLHLLTKEAFAIYLKHLREDGLLIMHISNRNVILSGVVFALADHFGLQAQLVKQEQRPLPYLSRSEWVLLSRSNAFFEQPNVRTQNFAPPPEKKLLWTDEFHNVLSVMKWKP